jgi:putative peptidoglycan lipid II flippase
VLTLSLLIPLRRLGLRIRPALRFDAHEVRALRPLVVAGVVTVGSQQLVLGLAIALSGYAGKGAVVVYSLAQTIYLLPWAVLAVPVATTAYPGLAEAGGAKDAGRFAGVLAPALRTVVVLTSLGAAALVVLAEPVAVVLAELSSTPPDIGQLAAGIAWFAPGLVGYGLFALLSRALYAGGNAYAAAWATGLGWAVVVAAAVPLAVALPLERRVAALAAANSIGMLVLAAALVLAVRARAGGDAVAGAGRTVAAAVASATVAATAALTLRNLVWGGGTPDVPEAVAQGMLCGVAVAVVFLAGVAVTDRRTLQRLIHRRG